VNPFGNASNNVQAKQKKAKINVRVWQDKKISNGGKNQIKCSDKHGNVASSTKCQQFDFPIKRWDKKSRNYFCIHFYFVNPFGNASDMSNQNQKSKNKCGSVSRQKGLEWREKSNQM
jgi:hypothetical protein